MRLDKNFLSNYKTYISGSLIILFSVLYTLGLLNQEIFLELLGLLLGTGVVSMRHAISKATAKVKE